MPTWVSSSDFDCNVEERPLLLSVVLPLSRLDDSEDGDFDESFTLADACTDFAHARCIDRDICHMTSASYINIALVGVRWSVRFDHEDR